MKKKPVVLYDQFINTHLGTWVNGQLVYDNFPTPRKTKSTFSFFSKTFRSFGKRPCRNQKFKLTINKKVHDICTDEFGYYSLFLEQQFPEKESICYEKNEQVIFRHTPIKSFDYRGKKGLLISDVDDTILLSYSTKIRKRIKTLFFTNPEKRKMIEGSKTFLNKIEDKGYGIIYLSNSESNLQPTLQRFIDTNDFPDAPLLLSRFLYWKDLFDKEIHFYKKTHKIESLLSICEFFENIPLILLGDSGQKDLTTYYEIATQYPERIERIIIHEIPWKPNTMLINTYKSKLNELNVNFELFGTNYSEISPFESTK